MPHVFKNILCLTVYESKGLEFDDVIIYNFFEGGDTGQDQWSILKDIIYNKVKIPKYDEDFLQDFDLLDNESMENLKKRTKFIENYSVG